MVVKLPGIPKRPGPLVTISARCDAGKRAMMLSCIQHAKAAGMQVLYISFDPNRTV